jgi:hypothetical protein
LVAALRTGFFATGFSATALRTGDLATGFLATALRTGFLATGFFAITFFTAGLAVVFLTGFLATTVFTTDFFTVGFRTAGLAVDLGAAVAFPADDFFPMVFGEVVVDLLVTDFFTALVFIKQDSHYCFKCVVAQQITYTFSNT